MKKFVFTVPKKKEDEEEEQDLSFAKFDRHTGDLYAVVCSPKDPTLVVTGGLDKVLYLWRIRKEDEEDCDWTAVPGNPNSIVSLCFSADGDLLASGGPHHGFLSVWDTSSGTLRHKFLGPPEGLEWLKWHPTRHIILAGSFDSNAWVFCLGSRQARTFAGHDGPVLCGDFASDGNIFCTGSRDGTLRIWNLLTGDCTHVVRGQRCNESLVVLAVKHRSTIAVVGTNKGSVYAVDLATGKVVGSLLELSGMVTCVEFLQSDADWVAIGNVNGKLIIWNCKDSSPNMNWENEEGHVTCLVWVGGSRYLAAASYNGVISLWDNKFGEIKRALTSHHDHITAMALSCDKKFLVSASVDGTARVFKVEELLA